MNKILRILLKYWYLLVILILFYLLYYYVNDNKKSKIEIERLKTNIEDLSDSLDKILKLKGISYNLKSNNEKHFGFIAQEVEKIFPEIIMETNVIGEPDDILYKTIRYQELIPHLTEAIKKQQELIENLNAKIEYLLNEIQTLKNKNYE